MADGTPLLAVCYGHQLLAQVLGGTVGANPNGRQIGTRQAQLTTASADDALFSGLPASFKVQASHVESVLELPEGAVLLARTDTDPNYAYRIGDSAWGVQFHPEFSADATRAYIKARKEALISEGLDPDELYSNVQETPVAHALIRKFADLVKDGIKGKAS